MLVDAPLPHGFGADLAVVGTLFEGFGRLVTSPPYLVGYARWTRGLISSSLPDNHSNSFSVRNLLYTPAVLFRRAILLEMRKLLKQADDLVQELQRKIPPK